jgi:hypothetical protein
MHKSISILVLTFFCVTNTWGQKDTTITSKAINDTFAFKVVKLDSQFNVDTSKVTQPDLKFDFKNQYPYYATNQKNWKKGDIFYIQIQHLPSSGYIYVFSVDGENNIEYHPTIVLDSSKKYEGFHYPDSTKYFEFKYEGIDKLVFWYSTDSIKNVQKLIGGIELTNGTSVKRVIGQLGKKLLLAKQGWYLTEDRFGFIIQKEGYEYPTSFILPLIVEFPVTKKEPQKVKVKEVKKKAK